MEEFYKALKMFVPADARVMYCQFRGDPADDIPGKWRAKVLNNPDALDERANIYVCVSAMKRNDIGEFRRRKDNFSTGLCLMVDDLGEGIGAHQPMATIAPLRPTALIETSPNNFQAVYMFDRPERDILKFEALIRAFIETQFLDAKDPGMNGVNRVFRPPTGINGKSKYMRDGKPWQVRLEEWNPTLRYSIDAIADAFQLVITPENKMPVFVDIQNQVKGDLIRAFVEVKRVLRYAGMLKREDPNRSGWIDIQCPWMDHHSDGANNGASIREPHEENGFAGAFRCHHGHCEGKGWRDLTEYINDGVVAELQDINDNAQDFNYYDWGAK